MKSIYRLLFPVIIAGVVAACSGLDTADIISKVEGMAETRSNHDSATEVLGDLAISVDVVSDNGMSELGLGDVTDVEDEDSGLSCQPGEGCFLDDCLDNSDCQSGWCVEHMGEGVCSQSCQDECPPGWECQQVAGTEPDVVYICVSKVANLCRPCAAGADCKSIGGIEDACVAYGTEGSFCGGACVTGEDCPWGFSCLDTATVDGIETSQCVADAGVCSCTQKSVALALFTPCEVVNDSGICAGKRVCTQEGLTDCDAAMPALESCNGVDDNCDGNIDESTCDDGNECTSDECTGEGGCAYTPLDAGECKDGDVCTVGDHCESGNCVGSVISCDDNNPCTDDLCNDTGGCKYEFNQDDCNDNDPCTVADECTEGECQGLAAACDCTVDSDCAALEDGDACNGSLICSTDSVPYKCVVKPTTVVTCPEPPVGSDAICLQAACDPLDGTCLMVPDHDGFACDDGDACTLGDLCSSGVCTAGPGTLTCNDGNPCTQDSCDGADGCVSVPTAGPCEDGNVCTVGDTCSQGECASGNALVCDDDNVCTGVETCNPATGCQAGQSLECDDKDFCNGVEVCDPITGCTVGIVPACEDGNSCTQDSCNPDIGCVHASFDGQCDDGNLCTTGDVCINGECTHSGLLNCGDGNICTTDACDPDVGCITILNDVPCDDDDVCTTSDHCHLGQCISSATLVCSDNNVCTADACMPLSGCTFTPQAGECDDLNQCTLGDTCKNGWCLPGPSPDCADDNICTDDSCDPNNGCQNSHNTAFCDDGNACTTNDQCGAGSCQPGGALDCDDENVCTVDTCNTDSGCQYTFNNEPCNDINACTTNEFCNLGICGGGVAIICDDGNLCTDDSCDQLNGCAYLANSVVCDDENLCTIGDVCSQKICSAGPDALDCDDSNECTDDSCIPASGCLHSPVANDTPCGNDAACINGTCVPNVTFSCADILATDPLAVSGVYAVDPDGDGGQPEIQVFCDMIQDEGGWTMVMNINTADGHMALLPDQIWTVQNESGNFQNRWSNDYKSKAAISLSGTTLLVIVRNHNAGEGGAIQGWRSWNLDGQKTFQSFFDVNMGSSSANATGGCNSGYSGDGRKQTSGIRSSGSPAQWDTFTNQADNVYTNSYYGGCGDTQDGFRLSSWYRWGNNSNVGLGLQMDGQSTSYNLEAGARLPIDTYGAPQRHCCGSCNSCEVNANGSGRKSAIGSDHYDCHCNIGATYRYEWYIR
jgi:hypothetical protein